MRLVNGFIILTGFILATQAAAGQQLEFRFGVNKTHLFQTGIGPRHSVDGQNGLGIGMQFRVQKLAPMFLLKNFEWDVELNRADIAIYVHPSPGGAAGGTVDASYRNISLGFNNYFVNFGTLDKPFQFALGLSAHYKLINSSSGYYEEAQGRWDPNLQAYLTRITRHKLEDDYRQNFQQFSLGFCGGVGFRSFYIGRREFRTRYDLWLGLTAENRNGIDFSKMNQRFTVGVLLAGNDRYAELVKLREERMKLTVQRNKERKERRFKKQQLKPTIMDKNLEIGAGVNVYQFSGFSGNGFGFGVRVWDWPGMVRRPAIALGFHQVNCIGMDESLSGEFQRNVLTTGIYPVKFLALKKRLDIRAGLDIQFLLSNQAIGSYIERNVRTDFQSDILKLHNHINAAPVVTMALPVLRKDAYCLRWRNTLSYGIGEMTVNSFWYQSRRLQSELAFSWQWQGKSRKL